jgi:hypothetical protein
LRHWNEIIETRERGSIARATTKGVDLYGGNVIDRKYILEGTEVASVEVVRCKSYIVHIDSAGKRRGELQLSGDEDGVFVFPDTSIDGVPSNAEYIILGCAMGFGPTHAGWTEGDPKRCYIQVVGWIDV